MSSKRPDRHEWLDKMGLPDNAAPFEILGRSFGKRVADTYEMFSEPDVDLVTGQLTFLVPAHGLKYMSIDARNFVDRHLSPGDTVEIIPELDNPADPRAQAVWTANGHKIGFVPAPVLDYVQRMGKDGTFQAHVVRVNRPSDGPHLRVIMRLTWTQD